MVLQKMGKLILATQFLLVLYLLHLAAPQNFKSVPNSTISTTAVKGTRVVAKPCECRRLCKEKCTGVSVRPEPSSSAYLCAYTEQATSLPEFWELVTTDENSTSFFRDQGCMGNFTLVEGVGCVFLSTTNATFDDARSSCPQGSILYSAESVNAFKLTRKFLTEKTKPGIDENVGIWVGLTKDEDAYGAVWRWNGLRALNETEGSQYWGKEDPMNGPSLKCAKMRYSKIAEYHYHLGKSSCDEISPFLCKQL